MFDLIAAWFVVGLFVAGAWLIVGSFLPASGVRPGHARPRRR